MIAHSMDSVRAEALFVSDVQSSDELTLDRVRAAVMETVKRHGPGGCAALVALEFGDHPEIAVPRMSWVLEAIRVVYPHPVRADRDTSSAPVAAYSA